MNECPLKSEAWPRRSSPASASAGAMVAVVVTKLFHWRTANFIGVGQGLMLLLFRLGTMESAAFKRAVTVGVTRGNFVSLFSKASRAIKYLSLIVVGIPIWFAVGVLVAFSAELGNAMGMPVAPGPANAVFFMDFGLAVGDLGSGLISQKFKSRKRALLVFLSFTALTFVAYFTIGRLRLAVFYGVCLMMGFSTGYWAFVIAVGGWQFGTNLRATAVTTTPNAVRGNGDFSRVSGEQSVPLHVGR